MIETNTLIQWAEDLVAFANDAPSNPLFNSDDADPDWAEYALPEEARTTDQVASLRKAIRRRLAELAKWQPSKNRAPKVPSKLRGMAEGWLEDPLVQSTHRHHALTPMDGVLSLTDDGRLQVEPMFRSVDAKYAVTFAELIGPQPVALIRRCAVCNKFFVCVLGRKGAPRKNCNEHRSDASSGRTYRTRKRRAKLRKEKK